jgi:hypothetical protein
MLAPSPGVVTSVRTKQSAAQAGHHFKVKVITLNDRTFGPTANATVTARSDALTIAGTGSPESFPTQLPIAAGQGLALFSTEAIDCAYSTSDIGDQVLFNGDPDPGPGAGIIAQNGAQSARVILEATIEPDADGDGYGDETQDSCPLDPAVHTGSCDVDLGVTQSVTPTTIGVGDVAVATVTLKNGSTGTGSAAALGATVTPGLQIVSTFPGTGCVFAPALSCPLGSLAAGGSVVSALVLKGITVGAQSVSSGVSASSTDPNAANNTTSSPITVERRVAVRCVVPKLTGLTKAFAKKLLAAVNCKLGKATAKKSAKGKNGTVIAQAKKAKTVLKAGSKVNVTLKK